MEFLDLFVWGLSGSLVGLVQPNKRDKPNEPDRPDEPNKPEQPAGAGAIDGGAGEKMGDSSQMGWQGGGADRRAS